MTEAAEAQHCPEDRKGAEGAPAACCCRCPSTRAHGALGSAHRRSQTRRCALTSTLDVIMKNKIVPKYLCLFIPQLKKLKLLLTTIRLQSFSNQINAICLTIISGTKMCSLRVVCRVGCVSSGCVGTRKGFKVGYECTGSNDGFR